MIEFLKRQYSTTMYRTSMAQRAISMVFWTMTLTGVWYPIFRDLPWFPVKGWILLALLLCTNFIGVYLIGWIVYDIGKMWDTEQRVLALRNPFIRTTSYPKEVIQLKNMWLPLLKAINSEGKLDEVIDRVEHWIKDSDVSHGLEEGELEEIIRRMEKS